MTPMCRTFFLLSVASLGACTGVNSDEEARLAYVGLDDAIGRALTLGLVGFGAANSANIPTQTGPGDVSGTMVVDGKVDQGASDNKGLRLDVVLVNYADLVDVDGDNDGEVSIVYATPEGAPADVDLKLRDLPEGTFTGSFLGTFDMDGDLVDEVLIDVELSGEITGGDTRVVGQTAVTGTATNLAGGVFTIDVKI